MEKSTFIFISEFPQTPPVSPSSGKKTYAETDSKANNPCWFRILRHQSKLKTIFQWLQFTGGSTRMSRIKDKCHNITRDGAKMQWFDQISNIVWSSGWHSCRAQTPTRGRKQHHLIFLLNLKLVKNNLHIFKKNYSPPVFYALCLEKVCKHVRLRQDKHFTSENVRINQEVPYIIIYGWIDIYEYIIFQI